MCHPGHMSVACRLLQYTNLTPLFKRMPSLVLGDGLNIQATLQVQGSSFVSQW